MALEAIALSGTSEWLDARGQCAAHAENLFLRRKRQSKAHSRVELQFYSFGGASRAQRSSNLRECTSGNQTLFCVVSRTNSCSGRTCLRSAAKTFQ